MSCPCPLPEQGRDRDGSDLASVIKHQVLRRPDLLRRLADALRQWPVLADRLGISSCAMRRFYGSHAEDRDVVHERIQHDAVIDASVQAVQQHGQRLAADAASTLDLVSGYWEPITRRVLLALAAGATEDVPPRLWACHPLMVQAGALIWLELGERPTVMAALRDQARMLAASALTDGDFRSRLRNHVLELLRFRPVFPVLGARWLGLGQSHMGRQQPAQRWLLTASILFDPQRVEQPGAYWPERAWVDPEDAYWVLGPRDAEGLGRSQMVDVLISGLLGLLLMPDLAPKGHGQAMFKLRYREAWIAGLVVRRHR